MLLHFGRYDDVEKSSGDERLKVGDSSGVQQIKDRLSEYVACRCR